MNAPTETTRTALLWRCRATPGHIFKETLLRLQSDGLRLPEGPNLRQKILDPVTGLFRDGQQVHIQDWHEGMEFAEHWDGFAFEILGAKPWTIELLCAQDSRAFPYG